MSVTFSIEGNPTGTLTVSCYQPDTGDVVVATADSYEAARTAATAHQAECVDCAAYSPAITTVLDVPDEFDVNVSNVNAGMLLRALGIDTADLSGVMSGDNFLAATLIALGTDRDDSGVAATAVRARSGRAVTDTAADVAAPGEGAVWVDCGVPAGYFTNRLTALHALAGEAARLGRDVVWA